MATDERQSAVFEFERLHEVCDGDHELEQEFLTKLLTSASDVLAQLAASLAAADSGRIHTDAHSLKGVCLTLGANALGATCGELEQATRTGDLRPARELLERAQRNFQALRCVIEPYLRRLSAQSA